MTKEQLKEALRPIAQGLFGKQGAGGYRYERPAFAIRPLGEMLEDLVAIPPEAWYRYAFESEPLNGKFTDERRRDYMLRSIECGRESARRVARELGSESPTRLAREMGLQVSYPDYPEKTDRVLFAEFRAPDSIRIYMDAIRRARVPLEQPGVREALTDRLDISSLLLAHELFHSVEDRYKDEIFTRNEQIELWHIGPFRYRSTVMVLGEIAAMAFAAELTGLPYSPYVMDVFLVYGYSPPEASGLYERMMECAGLTPRPGGDAERWTGENTPAKEEKE